MTTATPPAPTAELKILTEAQALANLLLALSGGRSATATGVDWAEYQFLLGERDQHRKGIRICYDRGRIELMSTSSIHEMWKTVLAALVECLAEETGRPFAGCGGVTVSSRVADRGIEPDECYYIQSVARVVPIRRLDFEQDPPPDLAIEVEFFQSVIGKLGLYAAFRVPEVWRYNGTALTILHLSPDGTYRAADSSLAFPELPIAELQRFVRMTDTLDQGTIVRRFRAWVRQTLVPPPAA